MANDVAQKTLLVESLEKRVEELTIQNEGLRTVVADDRKLAEEQVKGEMDSLMQKNLMLTQKNINLLDLSSEAQEELASVKQKLAESESLRKDLEAKLAGLKNALN